MKFRKDGYNITRKAYKKSRHIKKWERYKKRCIKYIEFYREHPVEFVEECFGVKLAPYQKIALTKTASKSQIEITC